MTKKLLALCVLLACHTACSENGASNDAADAGTEPDSGAETDPGTARDAGTKPDAAMPPDAGTVVTYSEVTIDFASLASGTILGNQYSQWAVFSSDPPNTLRVLASTYANSVEDWVCPSLTDDCSNDLFIDFTAPVTHVRFIVTLAHSNTRVVTARWLRNGVQVGERQIVGTGEYRDVIQVDLGDHAPIDRLELVDIDDYYGIGFDDFRFGFPD